MEECHFLHPTYFESVCFVVTSSLCVERKEVHYACQTIFLAFPRIRVHQHSRLRCHGSDVCACQFASAIGAASIARNAHDPQGEVTDAQGLTFDGAQMSSQAWMTNMQMATHATTTTPEGQGAYLVQIRLFMSGPWMISVDMQATNFTALRQTIFVQVQAAALPVCPTTTTQWEQVSSS
jgi:hypothetical protein